MRIWYILLTVFLVIAPAYGMEENDDCMRSARQIARPLIFNTLNDYVISSQNQTPQLSVNWVVFRFDLSSKDFVNKLSKDIIQFLKDGSDPMYLGCPYSFRGVAEALKKARIFLDKQTHTLKILPKEEADIQNIIDEFIEM